MGNELMKVSRKECSIVPVSPARRIMDQALGELGSSLARRGSPPPAGIIEAPLKAGGEVVDLPRYCAVHDQPYVSRYICGAKGRYCYGQSIRITEAVSDQYRGAVHARQVLPSGDVQDETCPWCGARGFASVLCKDCHAEVCYGRSIGNSYFYCRASCGSHGPFAYADRALQGLRPSLTANAAPASRK